MLTKAHMFDDETFDATIMDLSARRSRDAFKFRC
jgi:hypothetical protein